MRIKALSLAAFGLVVAVGCSSGSRIQKFDAAKDFPSEKRIAEIQASPAAEPKFRSSENEGRVDYWELAGPLPTTWGSQTIRSNSPLAQALAKGFDDAKMTESMACYAREVGLFYSHYEKYPYVELDDFMKRRCGMVAGWAAIRLYGFDKQDVPEADFLKASNWSAFVEDATSDDDNDFGEYGVWYGSGKSGTYVVLARATVPAKIKPVSLQQPAGAKVVVEGKLEDDADYVFGLTTRGQYGYGECTSTQGLGDSAFRVTCELKGNDPTVLVTINQGQESDVFSTGILEGEFRRNVEKPLLFVATGATVPTPAAAEAGADGATASVPGAQPAASAALPRPLLVKKPMESRNVEAKAFRDRMVAGVNRVRADAGLEPVTLEEVQSEANRELVPYAFGGDDKDAKNEALLGALAGWKVKSPVVNGTFRTKSLSNGDVDDFLNSMLQTPSGRRVLTAKEVDAIAIGTKFDEATQTVAVMITSYEFLEKRPHVERVNEFLDKLAKARSARGASPPRKVKALKGVADSLARKVEAGELEFHVATSQLWDKSLEQFQRSTHIYYGAAHDPLTLNFNEELLTMEPLRIAIMVTPFKPKNSPWYIYGIAIAFPKTKQVTEVAGAPAENVNVVESKVIAD